MEDLNSIISAIENISGEKYERSITEDNNDASNDKGEKDQSKTKLTGDLPKDLKSLTVQKLKNYCKINDIILPSNARKVDIIRIIRYVLGED